jgi:succinylglutamic semialdehyde dehydrogenase
VLKLANRFVFILWKIENMGKGHFINGKWEAGTGKEFFSTNPATEENIWEGREATEEEIFRAFQSAKKAYTEWKNLKPDERYAYLLKFGTILSREKESAAHLISQETGKPFWESILEIESILNKIKLTHEAFIQRCAPKELVLENRRLMTRYFPHGCVAVLGPFNFPGHLPLGHILPALLAGDTIVFKGSEFTPKVSESFSQYWQETDLPPGVYNMIQGGKESGKLLAVNTLLDGLFFTGNVTTGSWLLNHFSQKPEKILALEMGGNNPLIIETLNDPVSAAYLVIVSAYLTSGQRCSCARRLILIEGEETQHFLKTLKEMVSTIRIGPYDQDPEPFMGPVIHLNSSSSLLKSQNFLESLGGKILQKMDAIFDNKPFLTPGLIDMTEVKNRPDEEYFGPLLQLIQVNNLEEAILEANRTRFGLTAGLVSPSEESYRQCLNQLHAGIINWNTPLTNARSEAPFGGVGWSGNHRPSAYFAADYCSYPVASLESSELFLPKQIPPGIPLKNKP